MSNYGDSRYRRTPSSSRSLLYHKKTQQYDVNLDGFRKKIGLYVYGETITIDGEIRQSLRQMIERIRQNTESNPNQVSCSYYPDDEAFLSANAYNPVTNDLAHFERKFLALTLMNVFQDNVPKLEVDGQIYYVLHTLLQLGIQEDLWRDFHVEKQINL